MKRNNLWKRVMAVAMAAGMTVSLAACGGSSAAGTASGEAASTAANTDTSQTDFDVMSGISALSGGYDDNTVLKSMEDTAGIKIKWETQSDSIGEQVNVRIAGGDLPDAFQGVGFTNYELTNYGDDGTFINLDRIISP